MKNYNWALSAVCAVIACVITIFIAPEWVPLAIWYGYCAAFFLVRAHAQDTR